MHGLNVVSYIESRHVEGTFRPMKSGAINPNIFISNECLQTRVLPFIHKHHSDFNYIPLQDLTGAYYSK